MDVDERARIALDAARHMEDSGEIEDAAALLIQFNAWAELT